MLRHLARALDVLASLVIVIAGALVIHGAYVGRWPVSTNRDAAAGSIAKGMRITAPLGTDFARQDVTFARLCQEHVPLLH